MIGHTIILSDERSYIDFFNDITQRMAFGAQTFYDNAY